MAHGKLIDIEDLIGFWVDVHTLANFWNVDIRTVQNYADGSKYNPPLPRETKGQYNFIKAMRWMYEMQKEKIYKLETSGDENLSDLKKEKQIMDNKKAELELKKLFAQVVDKKTVLIAFTNIMNTINTNDTHHKYDLQRDLEGVVDDIKKKEIIEKSFTEKKTALNKLEIEKLIINEDALLEVE